MAGHNRTHGMKFTSFHNIQSMFRIIYFDNNELRTCKSLKNYVPDGANGTDCAGVFSTFRYYRHIT